MTRISLIVPCYNAAGTLPQLLASVEQQTLPSLDFELIVVDDGSTDGSAALARRNSRAVVLSQENAGAGPARNRGTQFAQGEVLAYTDADCILPHDFLERHLVFHEQHAEVDGVCGGVLPGTTLPYGSVVLADHLCSWFNAHALLPPRDPEYLWGANMSLKRRVLQAGVTWSESRMTGEDVGLSHRMRGHGMKLAFIPDLCVRHVDRTTLPGFLRHQYNWGFHAPFVRGRQPQLAYSWLFPADLCAAILLSPLIQMGYCGLVIRGWWRYRPLALLSALPWIIMGKAAYACGVLTGTRALQSGPCAVHTTPNLA